MATYVISDIHGEYQMFLELLEKIGFSDADTLYVLGDVLDRGPHPIKTVLRLMTMPNAICIVGNHEVMALKCLSFLQQEITHESLQSLDEKIVDDLLTWTYNGSTTTIAEFRALNREAQLAVIDFLQDFSLYERITVNNQEYLLVHAGLGNFSPEKSMEEYSLSELVWTRPSPDESYYDDIYVIAGHTPTQAIEGNPRPGYIYRRGTYIDIDCGSFVEGGRLGALCLETGEEFYSSPMQQV